MIYYIILYHSYCYRSFGTSIAFLPQAQMRQGRIFISRTDLAGAAYIEIPYGWTSYRFPT